MERKKERRKDGRTRKGWTEDDESTNRVLMEGWGRDGGMGEG